MRRSPVRCVHLVVTLLAAATSAAPLHLPAVFGDHMVLQRELPVPVWGWAPAGEAVTVRFADQTRNARADDQGRWRVDLAPLNANAEPAVLTVRAGDTTIEVNDVLVGEVWLCSGQSNMEFSLDRSDHAEADIAAAQRPRIRHVKTARTLSDIPRADVTLQYPWEVCTPAVAGHFTAVGYLFATALEDALNVPIGLVHSSWGGSNIEAFTPLEGFRAVPELADIAARIESSRPDSPQYRQQVSAVLAQTRTWLSEAQAALDAGRRVAPAPALPEAVQPLQAVQDPAAKYNAMIHGLAPFAVRGVLWYQGESNRREEQSYIDKTAAQLAGWRARWERPDLPYYYVQIAPYRYGKEDPEILATFWETQAAIEREIPHTHMAVINDVGNADDIHPKDKRTVGRRLAALALAHTYGRPVPADPPRCRHMEIDGDRVILTFTDTAGGLTTIDGQAPNHFEIAGKKGRFVAAEARIDGDTVVLHAPGVSHPVALRFAWHKLAVPNLRNGAGLPPSAFRIGRIPERALLDACVPAAADYRLLLSYDVGATAGPRTPAYRVDQSAATSPGRIDRIAYCLALEKADSPLQWVWVSCKAFTQDLARLKLPTGATPTVHRRWVEDVEVRSNVPGLAANAPARAYLEVWPHNYGKENSQHVPGASDQAYDAGDTPRNPRDGYGCLQIHLPEQGQTLLAVNHWTEGPQADVGIGTNPQGEPDYTFAANAGSYTLKRLFVLIRPAA